MSNRFKLINLLELSVFKERVYHGSLFPLPEGEDFNLEAGLSREISNQSRCICFTTSPKEASEVYATPPYADATVEMYRSEWFSRTTEMASRKNNFIDNWDMTKELRADICSKATPIVYPCRVYLTNPFVVSKKIPVHHHSEQGSAVVDDRRIDFYGYDLPVNLDKYVMPMASTLFFAFDDVSDKFNKGLMPPFFTEKSLSYLEESVGNIEKCIELAEKWIGWYVKSKSKEISNYNTNSFFLEIQDRFRNQNLSGYDSLMYQGIHDGLIIEDVKEIYSNAEKGAKHVMVFSPNRVCFELSDQHYPHTQKILDYIAKSKNRESIRDFDMMG